MLGVGTGQPSGQIFELRGHGQQGAGIDFCGQAKEPIRVPGRQDRLRGARHQSEVDGEEAE